MSDAKILFRGNTPTDYKEFITSTVKPRRATNAIKAIDRAAQVLHPGEGLSYVARGFEAKTHHAAILLLTEQRIIIGHHNQWASGGTIVLDYFTINKVTTKAKLGSKSVTFHHTDEETTISTIAVGDPDEIRDVAEALKASDSRRNKKVETHSDDTVERLSQLAQLHESGVLTDEEFNVAKRQILGM